MVVVVVVAVVVEVRIVLADSFCGHTPNESDPSQRIIHIVCSSTKRFMVCSTMYVPVRSRGFGKGVSHSRQPARHRVKRGDVTMKDSFIQSTIASFFVSVFSSSSNNS